MDRSSATESTIDENEGRDNVFHEKLEENAMEVGGPQSDSTDRLEGGNYAGGENVCSVSSGVNFKPPTFEQYTPVSIFKFKENDLIGDCFKPDLLYNESLVKFKKYIGEGNKGNSFDLHKLELNLPAWNLNLCGKFPQMIAYWDVNNFLPIQRENVRPDFPMPTTSFFGQACKCLKGPNMTNHSIRGNSKQVVLIGDDFLPPFLGCMGTCCPLIVRVPCTGDCEKLLDFTKKLFSKEAKNPTVLSPGSIIFVSLNSLLFRVSPQTYIYMISDFISRLGAHLENSFKRKFEIFPLLVPFSNLYAGSKLHYRISELCEAVKTVKGEIDPRHGLIFDAGLDFFYQKNPKPVTNEFRKEMTTSELYFSSNPYMGVSAPIFVGGGEKKNLVPPCPTSKFCASSSLASSEAMFWTKFGANLKKLGFPFPGESEIAICFAMSGRIDENRPFFTKFIEVTPRSERPIIVIGKSFGKLIRSALLDSGFVNIEFYEISGPSLCDDILVACLSEIKSSSKVIDKDPIVIFCGFGNSLLKPREGEELKVKAGYNKVRKEPTHILGQVSSISHADFEQILETTLEFLGRTFSKCILIPPMPRHFDRCCDSYQHFSPDFDGKTMVSNIIDWGVFMARSARVSKRGQANFSVPYLPSVFGDVMLNSSFNSGDGIHLTSGGAKIFTGAVLDLVKSVDTDSISAYLQPVSIEENVSLTEWISLYRTANAGSLPIVRVTSKQTVHTSENRSRRRSFGRGDYRGGMKRSRFY